MDKPRSGRKHVRGRGGEVEIPACEVMRKDGRLADRMLSILMHGVSTRQYEKVLPETAEQASISKSQVSREAIEAVKSASR